MKIDIYMIYKNYPLESNMLDYIHRARNFHTEIRIHNIMTKEVQDAQRSRNKKNIKRS